MKCEVCLCDPCDCEDMMGYNNELWGMGPEGNERDGKINPLAYERDWSFHKYGEQMAERNQAQNGIFPQSVPGDFQGKEYPTSDCDSAGTGKDGD